MRAVMVTRFGPPEVLTIDEVPDPVAGPGEVLVEVSAAPVDFVQTQLRAGFTPGPPLPDPPYLPGSSVGGVVSALGAGVDGDWLGRSVVGHTSSGYGANAERAAVAAESLVAVPPGVALFDAAALLDDGATALGLVAVAGVAPGEWVLVEAAAGGVGGLLVQLARSAGARVIGAARGESKLASASELGAEAVVDYTEPGWPRRVRELTGGRGVDLVFDGVGGRIGAEALTTVARGGRFSVHGAAGGAPTVIATDDAANRDVRVIGLEQLREFGAGATSRVAAVLTEAAAGRLRASIGAAVPFERAGEAHAAIESRAVLGKTLLVP